MSNPGLTPTQQRPADAIATVDADQTPTAFWRALLDHDGIRDAIIRAMRDLVRDRTVDDVLEELDERAIPFWLRSRILAVARGDRLEAWRLADELIPGVGGDVGTVDDLLATATLFEDLDDTGATVAVTMPQSFEGRRRDQREAVLRLIAILSQVFDVRLVATGRTQQWLKHEHREGLPGVSEWRSQSPTGAPMDDLLDQARDTLDPDGRPVQILRTLAAEPAETLSYHECYGSMEASKSRIRQCLSTLAALGLVEPFGPSTGRLVELRSTGRAFLDVLDADVGVQETLRKSLENWTNGGTGAPPESGRMSESGSQRVCVSGSGNSSPQAVLSREHGGGGQSGSRPYRTAYARRWEHDATAAVAQRGALTTVNAPVQDAPDHTRYVSHQDGRDEVVVPVRATGPLDCMVSIALALASPRLLDRALPESRLEGLLDEVDILRDARCVGALSEDVVDDPEAFRDALVEWGTDLEELTTKLQHGEYDDRDQFRQEILRTAHGLAGSVAHLLDHAGIDLIREVRVPGGLDRDQHAALARSVAIASAIQSRYGAFASYRQLFEDREFKRETALSPTVDATDPVGKLIGSWVIRSPDVHRSRPAFEDALASPGELHEDAPEFAVPIEIRESGRQEMADVLARVLNRKELRPTRAAVSLFHALTTPFGAAEAVNQLAADNGHRELRPDEIRTALAMLDAYQLAPDLPPSVGKLLSVLLRAEGRVSQQAIADRAGVTTRTVRNHRDTLQALSLLDITDQGWRLSLSFDDESSPSQHIVPAFVESLTALEAADAVLDARLTPQRYADPDDPLGELLCWPPDPWALQSDPEVGDWFELATRLGALEPPTSTTSTVTMGPELEQTPLQANTQPQPAD